MALTQWRPMGSFPRPEREIIPGMDRLLDEMRSWWESGELTAWTPYVNVYEKGDALIVEAEIPGMKKDEIEVSVQDHTLTLSGERKEVGEAKDIHFFRHERPTGSFSRTITLPSTVDADKIEAHYVLTLTIPKTEEAKAKRIEIH